MIKCLSRSSVNNFLVHNGHISSIVKIGSGKSAPFPNEQGLHKNRPHKTSEEVKNENKKYLSSLLNLTNMRALYMEKCTEEHLFFVKLFINVYIFETSFNLSIWYLKSGTCVVCDAQATTIEHKENYTNGFEL